MVGRKKNKTPPVLPREILLFHILPKLPVKSILRFKCVCKQWRSFVTTPEFAKIQLHHVTTVDPYRQEKVLFLHTSPPLRKFQTIDCEDGLISTTRCYPFEGFATLIASFVNGLACIGLWKNLHEFSDILLWNPLTGEYKTISRPIDTKSYHNVIFKLYYTCSDDDYKILQIAAGSHRNAYIYSLKSDSWRKLDSTLDHLERIPYANNHKLLDEKLHFLIITRYKPKRYLIIRLDLKTEKFTKIKVPSIFDGCLSLTVERGCIELMIWKAESRQQFTIEVLRMDGDGDWTKVVTSSYFPSPNTYFEPLHLMRNGNWLALTTGGICKIDPEKNIKEQLYPFPIVLINRGEKYIETFVSPNRYIN